MGYFSPVICALCLQDRTLSNSHIVPDFFFRKMLKDDKPYTIYVANSEKQEFKEFYRTLSQKMLCSECESKFSIWEGYAASFFDDTVQLGGVPLPARQGYAFDGADYRQLKLFFMSVIWRYSHSRNPWLKATDLGKHQERMRKMLLGAEPGEVWRYGFSIGAVVVDGKFHDDLIIPPSVIEIKGHSYHRMVMGGFLTAYHIGSHSPGPVQNAEFLQVDGSFKFRIKEVREIPFVEEVVASMSAFDRSQKSK